MRNTRQQMQPAEQSAFIFAHIAMFVVFFWFGFIKLFGLSPANELVDALLQITLPSIPFDTFIIILGLIEVLIGILFLIPRAEKIAITILIIHMFTTILPLFMLPHIAWQDFLIPTLEGQYIIKNIVIVALGASVLVDSRKR